ncbi:ABC transporter permease [Brevibacillus ginsengisoli]|uniref:ABC transporter permease n=1 Tax=Brevibacillus ginsengisoli TaxID=363854 RepID=UPI003CE7CE7E
MKSFKNTGKSQTLTSVLPIGLLMLVLLIWEIGVKVSKIEVWILPSPTQILQSLWEARELIWMHSVQTIYETLLGFVIAILAGTLIAVLMDWSDYLRKAVYPLLVITQTIPIVAIAPLFFIWFGFGITPKVIVVALVCFFPITVNLSDGFRLVDSDMIRLMSSMGAGRWQIFRMVKLPAAMPFFFSGLRIAGTYSVMGAVIGEWLGASKGLGILMTRSSQSFQTDRVFATIFVIVFLSLAMFVLIELIARVTMPWYPSRKE